MLDNNLMVHYRLLNYKSIFIVFVQFTSPGGNKNINKGSSERKWGEIILMKTLIFRTHSVGVHNIKKCVLC